MFTTVFMIILRQPQLPSWGLVYPSDWKPTYPDPQKTLDGNMGLSDNMVPPNRLVGHNVHPFRQTHIIKPFSCREILFHNLMSGMMDIGKASDVGHAVHWGAPMVTTACLKPLFTVKQLQLVPFQRVHPNLASFSLQKMGFSRSVSRSFSRCFDSRSYWLVGIILPGSKNKGFL